MRQGAIPRGQRPASEKAAHDFHHQQTTASGGKVLHDEDVAAAIRDRVLERGRLIHLDGPSGWTCHLHVVHVDGDLPSTSERLRISGINSSQFPELTYKNPQFRRVATARFPDSRQ